MSKGTLENGISVLCRNSKVFYANVVVEESPNLILRIVFPCRNLLLRWLLLKLHCTEWFSFSVETTYSKFYHISYPHNPNGAWGTIYINCYYRRLGRSSLRSSPRVLLVFWRMVLRCSVKFNLLFLNAFDRRFSQR